MVNINEPLTLAWPVANTGAATVTITLPDLTTATPSPVWADGAYTVAYTPATVGRYSIAWVQGANTFNDTFDAVTPGMLVTLADARAWLRERSVDTQDDTLLSEVIEVATVLIEDIIGPCVPRTYVEFYDGGHVAITPSHQPLLSVQSVVEYLGPVPFVLTSQPLGSQTNAFGYTVNLAIGAIERRTFGGGAQLFGAGKSNIAVTYTAGRVQPPRNAASACKALTKHIFETTFPSGRRVRNEDGSTPLDVGYAVPNFVLELLQPLRSGPGIA